MSKPKRVAGGGAKRQKKEDDEQEHRAIEALCELAPKQKPNPEPLAQILRSGRPLSETFRLILAELIDPKLAGGSFLDVKLVPKVTGARRKADLKKAKNAPIIKAMVAELRAGATVEAAAAEVADKLSISDRWAIAKWKEAQRAWPWLYGRRDFFAEIRSEAAIIANRVGSAFADPAMRTAILDAISKALERRKNSRS